MAWADVARARAKATAVNLSIFSSHVDSFKKSHNLEAIVFSQHFDEWNLNRAPAIRRSRHWAAGQWPCFWFTITMAWTVRGGGLWHFLKDARRGYWS
jgi:hypothetical protein